MGQDECCPRLCILCKFRIIVCQGNSYDEQLHGVVAPDTPNTISFPHTTICHVLQLATPVGIEYKSRLWKNKFPSRLALTKRQHSVWTPLSAAMFIDVKPYWNLMARPDTNLMWITDTKRMPHGRTNVSVARTPTHWLLLEEAYSKHRFNCT